MVRGARALAEIAGLGALAVGLSVAAGAVFAPTRHPPEERARARVSVPAPRRDDPRPDDPQAGPEEFRRPSGQPGALSCDAARRIVRQLRSSLAFAPSPPVAAAFAAATSDWLDPVGLWSVSADAPVEGALEADAAGVLRELEEEEGRPCLAARRSAETLRSWTSELAATFDTARRKAVQAREEPSSRALRAAIEEPLYDEGHLARSAAATAGERAGLIERVLGEPASRYADAARARLFPSLDADGWAAVVRAASVRAYVQLVDPHGAWAPADEVASVYDVDLESPPPERMWEVGVRTALGVRVDEGPLDPLQEGDVVVSIGGMETAALPVEQLDQLVYATTDDPAPARVVVLRRDEREVRTVEIPASSVGGGGAPESERPSPLVSYTVRYGAGEALVVEIHDVRSDLGEALAATLERDGQRGTALLLDLRDNGGGSTEAAIAALGLFLPGAPLFPMMRRDGSVEVDRAPEPPERDRWTGPVATLVDSDTASAAEMIAGALQSYRRGAMVGQRTYGKGCAQEYLDDDARVGVLRLTTLLYALPDGTPVQRVGIEPSIVLPPGPTTPRRPEHEGDMPNAPPTWRGPDVRDRTLERAATAVAWPDHHGSVGPCRDDVVCKALRALGTPTAAVGRTTALTPATSGGGRR